MYVRIAARFVQHKNSQEVKITNRVMRIQQYITRLSSIQIINF